MQKSLVVLACLLLSSPCVTGRDIVNPSITADDANIDSEKAPGYTIITTPQIQQATTLLDPNDPNSFIRHKESLGFRVQVIADAHGGKTGDDAAENIRAWLQSHCVTDNIEYVLLIGDPRPTTSEIPMKLLYPFGYRDADDPNEPIDEIVPSDLYYADLSGNWDLDGDGYPGEWDDDFGPGGVDREWEVLVGRIPYYPDYDEPNDLDKILSKIIHYENQDGEQILWRKSALLPMNYNVGACRLGEEIVRDILVPAEWSYHRIYPDIFVDDCESDSCPETTLTEENARTTLPEIWGSDQFGLVVWAADGGCADPPACEIIRATGLIDNTQVSQLDDNFPSFTFQVSCSLADPEYPNNLTYALLKHGAICTIGATRSTQGTSDEPFALGHHAMGMAYVYTSRIVTGMTCGQALFGLKHRMTLEGPDFWLCHVQYNIYGDPSLRLIKPEGKTIYVDWNATGKNDGSSWLDACRFLQDALAFAMPGDEIRIAEGTYRPDCNSANPDGTRDRTATFVLRNGVLVKGGYGGVRDDSPNNRDIQKYKTILSGEIGDSNTIDDNSFHVLTANSGISDATILDGLTIQDGNAYGSDPHDRGAGLYNNLAHPTLIDCKFEHNDANSTGGAIYNNWGSLVLSRCQFNENSAQAGGGIYSDDGSPDLTGCIFINNQGTGFRSCRSHVALEYCEFYGNSGSSGGGLRSADGQLAISNCVFGGNKAMQGGGIDAHNCTMTLTNCTIANNLAQNYGGGIVSNYGLILLNCILWDNSDVWMQSEDELAQINAENPIINYSCIQGCRDTLGVFGNINVDPNFADSNNGDYHLKSQAGRWDPNSEEWVPDGVTSPCIDAGNPGCLHGDEPNDPNNTRINMGAYGGTAEASRSPASWRSIADLTNDFEVDFSDFEAFARYWLDNIQCAPSDLNRNGFVDFADLAVFADDWLR